MEQRDGLQREETEDWGLPIMGSVWLEEFINSSPCLHLCHNPINSHAINTTQRKHLAHDWSSLGFVREQLRVTRNGLRNQLTEII